MIEEMVNGLGTWLSGQMWRSTGFAAIVVLLCLCLRRSSGQVRYLLWVTTLLSMVVPCLALVQVHAPVLEGLAVSAVTSNPVLPPAAGQSVVLPGSAPSTRSAVDAGGETAQLPWWFWGWLAGVAALGSLSLSCMLRLGRLCRSSDPAPAELRADLDLHRRALGVRQTVGLRITGSLDSPCVVGCFRPVLLIPRALLRELRGKDWKPVLVHELLHVRRGDLWVHAFACLTRALFFFHPVAWLAVRRLAREREIAVDESVVAEGGVDSMEYGKSLIRVASAPVKDPVPAHGVVALSRHHHELAHRLRALRRPRPAFHAWPIALLASLLVSTTVAAVSAGGSDEASRWLQAECESRGIELPAVPGRGVPTQAGGVRTVIFLPQGRAAEILPRQFESSGAGFSLLPLPLEVEEVLEEVEVIEEVLEEEEVEEIEEEEVEEIEVEEIEEIEEGGEFEIVEDLDMEISISVVNQRVRWSLFGRFTHKTEELAEILQSQLGETQKGQWITVYASPSVSFGAVAQTVGLVRATSEHLWISFGGVPGGAELRQVLASGVQPDTTADGGWSQIAGDVLLVTDHRVPWSRHAQLMQALGSRKVSRITFAAVHEGEITKVSQYLPVDIGVTQVSDR